MGFRRLWFEAPQKLPHKSVHYTCWREDFDFPYCVVSE